MEAAQKRTIRKVVVLGSGVMGSQIACHFANIGVSVLLLDIVPREVLPVEQAAGLTLESPAVRNRIVNQALQQAKALNPNPLYEAAALTRIATGNFDDNLHQIAEADWVIEVIIERLDIKQQLYERVEQYRKKGSLITSNTSGIPMGLLTQGRSEDFVKHFCGTHFFNPPRYLRLLEIIPGPGTATEVVDFLMHYGDLYLGKTTVKCLDTPAFIANRLGIYAIMETIAQMELIGLTVDEIDQLTGTLIGHPKSATFRTADVVGLDTLAHVANQLYGALPNDEQREKFRLPGYLEQLVANQWIGDKKGQGFYKKVVLEDGTKQILTLDVQTLSYSASKGRKFATVSLARQEERFAKKLPILLSGKDEAGQFYRKYFAGVMAYAANRIPEISHEVYNLDLAIKSGFGWEYGIFETWDVLGLSQGIALIEQEGFTVAPWVKEMLAAGITQFYTSSNGKRHCYLPANQKHEAIKAFESFLLLPDLKDAIIWKNAGCAIQYLGDGIINLEFRSKSNTLGSEVIEGLSHALDLAEKEYAGLTISNEGPNFSVGANLALVLMYAAEEEWDELDMLIRYFQRTMMRVRYSAVPVVVAPHQMAFGGGCELSLHADQIQMHAETYIGLVEVGVGLIPGGGGTKEMARRAALVTKPGDVEINVLQQHYMHIATGRVSKSAHEARQMSILRPTDGITMNRDRLLADAKAACLQLAASGYSQPQPEMVKVQGRTALGSLLVGVNQMLMGGYISAHDAYIANELAYVICGGDLTSPQFVSEQYLLDLEREAFTKLCGTRKTQERIHAILTTNKALRN